MKLSPEERRVIVVHRLQKAKDTLHEAKGNVEQEFWHTVANRLYYACYYAVSALLIHRGFSAHTHSGIINLFGLHFISTNIVSKEYGKFYGRLFELRQKSDYNDWVTIEASDVEPLVEPAEEFIALLERMIAS